MNDGDEDSIIRFVDVPDHYVFQIAKGAEHFKQRGEGVRSFN